MVFTFPPDFEQKAHSYRRKEGFKVAMKKGLLAFIQILKVIVAFGLIISLTILIIAGICAMIALLIALSRGNGGGHNHRHVLNRNIRSLIFTLREILWFYALFAPDFNNGEDQQGDPFLREVAQTLAMMFSLCLSSPTSLWFWLRMRNVQRRQNVFRDRGWKFASLSEGAWRESVSSSNDAVHEEGRRGILSIAVEFLFGTTPFFPGPGEKEKWKIREEAVVFNASTNGISLLELLPFADHPPSSTSDPNASSAVMNIISHFNGVPVKSESDKASEDLILSRFAFPELIAEANDSAPTASFLRRSIYEQEDDSWNSFLYKNESPSSAPAFDTPSSYLREHRHVLTRYECIP